ncbi:acyl--CoA ligase [Shewanella olleyana]|uniref:class I adenylate-forming enzyme family protein n=1 Tax=Shewanella olleyana TaxID=135626 RepID=UPI00201070AE|nr:class I adenylate-forming enzyme family protein [Shewanella olleyana]MCL1066582.1 acyl--CoA ligase [Shewanella olleyana]
MSPIYSRFQQMVLLSPDKVALHIDEQHYTYAQLLDMVDNIAARILTHCNGIRPRVALITLDQIDNVCVSLALAKLGGCCIPMNAHMLPEQLQQACEAVDATMVIGKKAFIKKTLGQTQLTYLFTDTVDEQMNNIDMLSDLRVQEWMKADDYLITLSSGSTGKPKPIMISQDVKLARAEQTWSLYQLTANDIVLCASPFFHSLGQRLTFVPLLLGAEMVHLSRFTPAAWLAAVKLQKVSFIIAVSSHLYALKNSLLSNAQALNSLRTIVTSSAPIDAAFKAQVFQAIGCDFHEIYGATEIAVATNLAPKDASEKYQTVGAPCEQVNVLVLDEDLKAAEVGEIGQIAVKSPLRFNGYYKNESLSQAALKDEYFLTGDIGKVDHEGFLTYVGRQKDIIISGGINIYPKDIETALLKHELLNEVAVVGIDDSLLGEVIIAVCITDNNNNIEPELRKLSNKTLAPFQRPLKFFFPEFLPLTSTGKVSKLMLREEYCELNDGWTDMLRVMLYGEQTDE